MRSGYIIKNHLDKIGIEATLYDGEWNSMPFKCTVNPLWRKKSSAFDDDVTELGTNEARYHLYVLVRKTHNVMEISDNGYLETSSGKYKFLRENAVKNKRRGYLLYRHFLREIRRQNTMNINDFIITLQKLLKQIIFLKY